MAKSPITTHVLDTAHGRPAEGIRVTLERLMDGDWRTVGEGVTDEDGRIGALLDNADFGAGVYRITFITGFYFGQMGTGGFYPVVPIIFEVKATDEHYHVPLLLNPFGYSTYRGS